jgi:hypothetical protein
LLTLSALKKDDFASAIAHHRGRCSAPVKIRPHVSAARWPQAPQINARLNIGQLGIMRLNGAQALAQGKTANAAYEHAGYKPNRHNASRLKTNETIKARILELQQQFEMLFESFNDGAV